MQRNERMKPPGDPPPPKLLPRSAPANILYKRTARAITQDQGQSIFIRHNEQLNINTNEIKTTGGSDVESNTTKHSVHKLRCSCNMHPTTAGAKRAAGRARLARSAPWPEIASDWLRRSSYVTGHSDMRHHVLPRPLDCSFGAKQRNNS